jgi:threonine dehydratase
MTHEYTLALGGRVRGGEDASGVPSAIAWAMGAIVAIGDDTAVRLISRGDSLTLRLDGAIVTGPGSDPVSAPPPRIGDPADLAVWAGAERPPRLLATVVEGRFTAGDPRTGPLREGSRAPTLVEVLEARTRIAGTAIRTPLEPSPELSAVAGGPVRLKLESAQPTGSFKIRGAVNRVGALAAADPATAILTASSGNHAINVAHAAKRAGLQATLLVPASAARAKLDALRALETAAVRVELVDGSTDDAESTAVRRADAGEGVYVSPYDDTLVMAGTATIAWEVLEDWPRCAAIVVPVGGGGLIGGIAVAARALSPGIRVIGVQPRTNAAMAHVLRTGTLSGFVDGPTLAEGVAGGIAPGAATLAIARSFVDEIVLVEEAEIADAMRWAIGRAHLLVEPSGALGIAALRSGRLSDGLPTTIVVSGRNVSPEIVARVVATG